MTRTLTDAQREAAQGRDRARRAADRELLNRARACELCNPPAHIECRCVYCVQARAEAAAGTLREGA
jgi:hypothetical protein